MHDLILNHLKKIPGRPSPVMAKWRRLFIITEGKRNIGKDQQCTN